MIRRHLSSQKISLESSPLRVYILLVTTVSYGSTIRKQTDDEKPKATNLANDLNGVHRIEKDWLDDVDDPGRAIPGVAGRDFPVHKSIPNTTFSCTDKEIGFYADEETDCQVWHYCRNETTKESHLCPNGTIYNTENSLCEWWFNVDCEESAALVEDDEEFEGEEDFHYVDPIV